jgi:uncharacterized protein YwqG
MGILNNLFKWFTAKDKHGKEMNVGYVLDGEPQTIEDIEKVFKAFQLEKYFEKIVPFIRPKIDLTFTPVEESEIGIGNSKIGGYPDLPKLVEWPKTELGKSMSFIAQLNCNDLSKYDSKGLLPNEGMISFFYCADQEVWGFDIKDKQRFKVIFTDKNEELFKSAFPSDLETQSIFKPNQIQFNNSLSLPTWDDDSIKGLIKDDDLDNYIEASSGSENQIFGYANAIQGTMELECQLVTNGLYCGDSTGYENPRRNELEKDKNDWVLLLQIDSEVEKTGMSWGDEGRLYYWIKKQDLKNKNFDKAWFIVQC